MVFLCFCEIVCIESLALSGCASIFIKCQGSLYLCLCQSKSHEDMRVTSKADRSVGDKATWVGARWFRFKPSSNQFIAFFLRHREIFWWLIKNENQFRNDFVFPVLDPTTTAKPRLSWTQNKKTFLLLFFFFASVGCGAKKKANEKYQTRFLFVFHDCQFERARILDARKNWLSIEQQCSNEAKPREKSEQHKDSCMENRNLI